MTQRIRRSVNIENPTARDFFLSDHEILSATDIEQMEDNFFFRLRLPNGTKKTTYRHRLDDVALACNRLLSSTTTPLRLMDVGISSGVTTKEWMDILDGLDRPYCIDAIDLCLYGMIESLGEGFHILRDSSGQALQYEIWGWALANHYGQRIRSRVKRFLPVSLARIAFAIGCLGWGNREQRSEKVSFVTRGLETSDRLRLHEADIFQIGNLGRTFHMIRAANILNRAYFSNLQLESVVKQLLLCMDIGSYLVVVRTREDMPKNDGTIFIKKAAGNLGIAERFGTGSEIEPIVLGLND